MSYEPQDGLDGLSAFEIAVARGFRGTADEWLASLKGADGALGRQGDVGPMGPQGERGETGPAGRDGINGKDGARGPRGERGQAGKDATLPSPQSWSADLERDAQFLTKRMTVTRADGGLAYEALPVYSDVMVGLRQIRVMTHVDINPIAA